MKWSWRIGAIAGIGIYLHNTFLILLGFITLSHLMQGHSLAEALGGLLFITSLFSIIVLHELGHALTARRFGIKTKDITLLPIGGLARLERIPDDPKQELLVALAGPAVNVVLAAGLFVVLLFGVGVAPIADITLVGGQFVAKLLWVNVGLAIFNMLPAFPMDGGRVLRAALAIQTGDYRYATHVAANIGQAMALLFGFAGLFSNPFLIFIALFVWMGAAQEESMVQTKSALGGIPLSRAMITEFHTLSPDESLENAVAHVLAGFQHDFPVVENGAVVGVLTRADLLAALAAGGSSTPVREAMQKEFVTADPGEMLERAFARLQSCGCHSMPIVRGGKLVGMLTLENVGEFLMIQSALHHTRNGPTVRDERTLMS